MEVNVQAGEWYVVEGDAGDTVTNPLTGRVIATVEDGKQSSFLATTPYVVTSSDTVGVHKANFNSAPAKLKALGLLGGGAPTLPAGYLAAAFLRSNLKQKIPTGITSGPSIGAQVSVKVIKSSYQDVAMGDATGTKVTFTVPHSTSNYNGVLNGNCEYHWNGSFTTKAYSFDSGLRYTASLNYKNNRLAVMNGTEWKLTGQGVSGGELCLFAYGVSHAWGNNDALNGYMYYAKISDGDIVVRNFIPAVDNAGNPCMFDTVTKSPFYNTGTAPFSVGLSANQARRLSSLPETGGSMTILLPITIVSGSTVTDSAVNAALTTARSKGWNITVQTYTEETASAASTFGLRRIWVRKTKDENGSYVDAEGTRWQVDWCVTMYTPDDSTPDMHGYELFRSVEAATEYWGLEPYVDPAWEEELLTETN